MKCAECGVSHGPFEPVFKRPDAVVDLGPYERKVRIEEENDDLCVLRKPWRYFARCLLKVAVWGHARPISWGIWVEIDMDTINTIIQAWDDPNQARLPAMKARIANQLPSYPTTIDLPVMLQLTGPKSRPELSFRDRQDHPLVLECLNGVAPDRVAQWITIASGGAAPPPS